MGKFVDMNGRIVHGGLNQLSSSKLYTVVYGMRLVRVSRLIKSAKMIAVGEGDFFWWFQIYH